MEDISHYSKRPLAKDNLFGKGFSYGNMNSDGRVRVDTSERSLTCDICERRFTNVSNLNRHLKIHTGEKPLECDVCKKKFSQKNDLKSHVRIHTGEKPYGCDICKKKFSHESNLKCHIKIHVGEKLYECHTCKKRFLQKCHLEKHIRVHTGEKPYECIVCKKKFSQDNKLKTHMRIHTGEVPYECNICRKKFSIKCHMESHMKYHTGVNLHECNICMKKFSEKFNLKIHMRIHTGEKPFKCNICKRNFSQKSHLERHMRIHTGLPCASLERSENMRLVSDDKKDFFCIQEEISDGCDGDKWSDHGTQSHGTSEVHLDESIHVVGHVDLCNASDGTSHYTNNDTGMGLEDDCSFKVKTGNVFQCRQKKLSQMVKNVLDGNTDCQRNFKNDDSQHVMCICLKQEEEEKQRAGESECRELRPCKCKDLGCTEYNKVDGYINIRKEESESSKSIMTGKNNFIEDDQEFDIQKVYIIEAKNSRGPDAEDRKNFQCHLSDNIFAISKEIDEDESLSYVDIKEESNLL